MNTALALVAAVLVATPAVAEVYVARDAFRFSLSASTVVRPGYGDPELEVRAMSVRARHGARRASRGGPFEQLEVTVLQEPYDLTDAAGGRWRMWIRSVSGPVLVVELIRARPAAPRLTEQFIAESLTIDGQRLAPKLADLTLFTDGTYRLGTVVGQYQRDEAGVRLDGAVMAWGRGSYSLDLDGLTFRYLRVGRQFEIKFRLNQTFAVR